MFRPGVTHFAFKDMSRPLKSGLDYFPHDTDAVGDEKIQALMALHGTAGYSFYFIMLEKVFRTENARITLGSDAIKAGFAKLIGITLKQFNAILNTALEVGCFDSALYAESNIISSLGIQKRINKVSEIRLKERERKENIKEKSKEKEKTKHGKPSENSDVIETKHKYGEFKNVFLTDNEYQKLKDKFNSDAEKWIKTVDEGIEYKGYKYKSHYLAILKWAENKVQGKKYL